MAENTTTQNETVDPTAGEHADSGAQDGHGPALGRHVEHPPEPPHLIQVWYELEQEQLIENYVEEHPDAAHPTSVETWLKKNEQGEWEEVEGQNPTAAQVLHYGSLKEKLPLVGYAPWENHVYFGIGSIVLILFFLWITASYRRNPREAQRRPSRRQMLAEMIVGGFDDFCKGVLGEKNGRMYMPFIGTLFMLILFCNLMGLVPLMRAPTSSIVITGSLALCTFVVVQGTAWVRLGPLTYIHHLAGSPQDVIGWCMSPLFLILELISDFIAKPVSLALRLFGNILGKDILLGAFLGMGISLVSLAWAPLGDLVGLPLTIPFYFLGMLLSAIQALVFALLSTIYITLVLPHDDHHGEEEDTGSHSAGSAPSKQLVQEEVPS